MNTITSITQLKKQIEDMYRETTGKEINEPKQEEKEIKKTVIFSYYINR